MRGKNLAKLTAIGFFGITLLGSFLLYSQETDPFYTKLLENGEKLFLARNYTESAKILEIAAFGLHREPKLRAKSYVYVSLSFYYLKDFEKCEEFLRKAGDLMEGEGFDSLDLKMDELIWGDLNRLVNHFNLSIRMEGPAKVPDKPGEPQAKIKPAEARVEPRTQVRGTLEMTERGRIKALEQRIKKEPRNTSLYYDLYEIHRRNNDYRGTKKVLESMLKKNPNEVNGHYLLGIINYNQRKYKDAVKYFDYILKLSGRAEIGEEYILEAKAYLLLCYYYPRETNKIQVLLSQSLEDFSEEKIRSLALERKDKSLLRDIIESNKSQAAAIRIEIRKKTLENTLKRERQNVSLYYELYILHMAHNKENDAKDVLKSLVKYNPNEFRGMFLLGKIEYSQKKYKDALTSFNHVLRYFENIQDENDLNLKSSIYISLCLFHLSKKEHAESYITGIKATIPADKLAELLKEEGLEEEWGKLGLDSRE